MYPDNHIPAQLPSTIAVKKYGVPLSTARYLVYNYFELPTNYLDLFRIRYLLSWNVSYFLEELDEGTITRKGTTYQVIYHRTSPVDIKKHTGQVLLSFRALQSEFDMIPVVLVTRDFSK